MDLDTNVVTMVPIYYVFYVTGQLMLGHWSDMWGYHTFVGEFQAALHPTVVPLDPFDYVTERGNTLSTLAAYFVKDLFGVMLLGSVPFGRSAAGSPIAGALASPTATAPRASAARPSAAPTVRPTSRGRAARPSPTPASGSWAGDQAPDALFVAPRPHRLEA